MKRLPIISLLVIVAQAAAMPAQAVSQAAGDDAASFFEARIRPVLVKECYGCHSAKAGKSEGGLQLDSRQGLLRGGQSGPAVVPFHAGESLLLRAIQHSDDELQMPAKRPMLAAAIINDFAKWIRDGAIIPSEPASNTVEATHDDARAGREFWSYVRPVASAPPQVQHKDWPLAEIDSFVLAKLEQCGLTPSEDAEPIEFLRRLYFDLIGLPPTPEQVEEFRMENLAATVDKLLASPRFGERWGRHWLDVARFAESNGRESNLSFPHAWRYRDYVIDAVNADIPFDRFIAEQLAGDLLPAGNDADRARLLIATGFLAIGAKGLNEMNKEQFLADVADEQIDTVTRAFLASSVACARCHDHKTDPFTMEDYYALAGIFKSTQTCFGNWIDSENNNDGELIPLPDLPGQIIPNRSISSEKVKQLKNEFSELAKQELEQQQYALKAKLDGRDISNEFPEMLRNAIRIYWTRGAIQGQLRTVDDEGRALPLCMGVRDARAIANSRRYERGDITHPGREVPRGFPKVPVVPGEVSRTQSGRLELARWISSRDNPLTARVMANRVWHHLFGAGLVRTPDNFGFSGDRPSHPELLDHLALRLMDCGWSVKSLIREIVLSHTYRQSSIYRTDAFAQDPGNLLLWRVNKRRLDAEVIRDSMLSVSGLLDFSRREGSLVADLDGQSISLIGFNDKLPADLDGMHRRSVFLPIIRDRLPDVLEQFDAANPNLVTGGRDVTNVPPQALYLLNSAFVQDQASALALRLTTETSDPRKQVDLAFKFCFNRSPHLEEKEMSEAFLISTAGGGQEMRMKLLTLFCQALLATGEFRCAD